MSQYKINEIINDNVTEIRYVYHISDTHIRKDKRHEEFAEVFHRTYEKIKSECKNKEHQSIIMLTGDIVDTKTDLTPDAYTMTCELFRNLSSILPTILIAGNHDCIVSNPDKLDALTPIVANSVELENMNYLTKTGFYQYHNIVFGLTDLFTKDPLLAESMPKTFKTIPQQNKYKIALYHGIIRGSKTDLGHTLKSERFRSKDFRGYDYGFFGDIHKFQYMNDQKTMAYSGSLIQQNYGETLNNHGILKWDLLTGKSNLLEIPNDYGFCIINLVDGKMIDKNIPKKPRIKFILNNTTQIQYQQIVDSIEEKYDVCEIVKEDASTATNVSIFDSESVLVSTNHNEFIKSYLAEHIEDDTDRTKIYKLHKRIYNELVANNTNPKDNIGGQYWKLIELKFSNLFSYGKGNIVNLAQYEPNQIIGIFAPNHHGKSAILDIILYCLFGKSSRGGAREIMNKDEKLMSCSLLFSIGENKYLISKTADRGKTGSRMDLTTDFIQIKKNGKQKNLNGIDKEKTKQNIIDLIGSYDDYLTSYICTQDQESHGNFMKKTDAKKKEYLYNILKLNVFDNCYEHANNKSKIISKKIKILEDESKRIPIVSAKQQTNELQNILITLAAEKYHASDLLMMIDDNPIKKNMPVLTKYHELSIYNLNSMEDIQNTIADLKTKMKNTDCDKIIKQITIHQKSISALKKEKSQDNLISSHNEKIQELYSKIINVPINKNINLDTLLKNKNDFKSKISSIDKSLAQLNEKMELINSATNKKISKKESDALTEQLKMNNDFSKHVTKTIKYINLCNDKNINSVLNLQNDWLENYNEWKIKTTSLLAKETYDLVEIKNQIESLTNQKETIIEKLSTICEKIDNLDHYQKQIDANEKIKVEIKNIKAEIQNLELIKSKNKTKINNLKELINECNTQLTNIKNYEIHIDLLIKFESEFKIYCGKKITYDKYVKKITDINKYKTKLDNITYQIDNTNLKLSHQEEILKEYQRLNTEIENVTNKKKIYESYCKMMNINGIPYEILKNILPKLEAKVNHTLHNMVNFNIEFIYHKNITQSDDDNDDNIVTTTKKPKAKKTTIPKTKVNSISIHIHYQNKKPYDANLTSGFEKFIIGLAIRMVLCDISKSAKPNFFIVDEGWSCLDSENLANLDNIMAYIKNQFEHVIIISHLDELKDQADHTISISKKNIGKKNEYSYINNTQKAFVKKKLKIVEV